MQPIFSIIIPTKNAAVYLETCLRSIFSQKTKLKFEVVVIDNFSTDLTAEIAKEFPVKFYEKGPERHTQRRFGMEKARANVFYFLDADMYLEDGFLNEIEYLITKNKNLVAIVPEKPFGAENFWTKAKILERSLYKNDDLIEAARIFNREIYKSIGGFDPNMIAMEDWDLTVKCREAGYDVLRTTHSAYHNEGYVNLANLFSKKCYYGKESKAFVKKNGLGEVLKRFYFFRPSFWKRTPDWIKTPFLALGMLCLFLVESIAGLIGILTPKK